MPVSYGPCISPVWAILLMAVQCCGLASAEETQERELRLAGERMDLMRSQAQAIRVVAPDAGIPGQLESQPLFRYDDHTRGYIDAAVWRLGRAGRPQAIITTELHPHYLGGGARIVYDFLSITPVPFSARSHDVNWTPSGSAIDFQTLPNAAAPAATAALRGAQLKQLAERFTATQAVEGQKVRLRLLSKPIDRYVSRPDHDRSDGALFLLCNGRNPAITLFLETDGESWTYGLGRLSLPSVLIVQLDGEPVWEVEAFLNSVWNQPYCAANFSIHIPGYDE
ncbi:MAG: hypothetical protein ACK5Q5_15600 [Planctomycetaceae bacterium]